MRNGEIAEAFVVGLQFVFTFAAFVLGVGVVVVPVVLAIMWAVR